MGVLRAAATVPALLLSLLVGVWVDRLPRRPILVLCDLGRAALFALVPLAALTGLLRIELMYAVALLAGVLTVVFDIAVTSYLPALVRREELFEANARLQLGGASTKVVLPGVAGWLVQALGAPLALGLDVVTHLTSGLLIGGIRADEPPARAERGRLWAEIAEGWRAVWDDPVLRTLILATTVGSFGGGVRGTVYLLYATDELGIGPAVIGLLLAANGAATVVGALAAGATGRWSVGRVLVGSQAAVVLSGALVPLAAAASGAAVALLVAAQLLIGVALAVYSVTQISLRQAIVPSHLLGRVNATRRVLVFGVQPIAALVGGLLGDAIGLTPTLVLAAGVDLAALAAVLPLRRVAR
jgi:MFS family permease